MKKSYIAIVLFIVITILVVINLERIIKTDRYEDTTDNNNLEEVISIDTDVVKNAYSEFKGNEKWATQTTPSDNGYLSVYFLDVGQGYAILIENANDTMLIDGGAYESYEYIQQFMSSKGIESLDYVAITKPSKDSMNSIARFFNEVEVETVLIPSIIDESLVSILDEKEIDILSPKVNDYYMIGDGKFSIIEPLSVEYEYLNNNMAGLYTYEDIEILFAGDFSTISKNTSMPKLAILSVGYNKQGLINITGLEKLSIPSIRTDEVGTISLTSDGYDYNISY